jgi:hypothetical protein
MNDALQEIRDREEIIGLTITYAWLLDHGPRERLDTVFVEDVTGNYRGVRVEGLQTIIEMCNNALDPLTSSQHLVSNQQVKINGDTATCRCYLQAQHTLEGTEGGDNYIVAGRYEDELIRTPDGWRITHRALIGDWTDGNPKVRGLS